MDLGKFVYPVEQIKLSLRIRIKNTLIMFFGANGFYRKFCKKNGIDLPLRKGVHWSLPEYYVVEHNRIDRLAESRDRIIAAYYNKYAIMQDELDTEIKTEENKINHQEEYLAQEKDRLEKYKHDLAKSKDSSEIIFLESSISAQKSLISNQTLVLDEMVAELAQLNSIMALNFENWNDQLKNIEDEITNVTYKFIFGLARKVRRKLSFSDFKYMKPEYSEKVLMIVQSSKQAVAHKVKVKKVK